MARPQYRFTFALSSSSSASSAPSSSASSTGSNPSFDVVEFKLEEGLNETYRLEVELISLDANIDFKALLDQAAVFTIWNEQVAVRHVHGLVSDFSQGDTGFRRTRYSAVIEPDLARTQLSSDWRIFQQKSVPEILREVFKEAQLNHYDLQSNHEHLQREYCVQADESDFEFIQRLLAEEGFAYHFKHEAGHHQLVLSDAIQSFGAIEQNLSGGKVKEGGKADAVIYNANPAGEAKEVSIHSFHYQERVRTAQQTQRDYTFKNPRYAQEHTSTGKGQSNQSQTYEQYAYPGRYKADAAGKPFTQTKLLSLRANSQTATAKGDDARVQLGLAFELTGHPRSSHNSFWRAVHITHQGTQHSAAEEEAAQATQSTSYSQTAELVPATTEWKAPIPAKPRILGPQIAHVTGPEGEEIYTDEYGRVKVLFPWDRQNAQDEHSSCWIRVSQGWAGAAWGQMEIPRIGQEVIISFLDADPDQPIISGRAHDAIHPTPYKLPGLKTLSTLKSKEHKGDGYNELLIDDTTGELKTQLHSTHAATQLTLGYLTHPRSTDGSGEHRGDGFELRSDDWGSIRAGKGIYISSNEQKEAKGQQLDLKEAIEQLSAALSTAQMLANQAEKAKAIPAEINDQEAQFNDVFTDLKKAGVLTSSAAGTAITTAHNAQVSAERNIALTSGKSTDISSMQNFTVAAGNAISLFSASEGMKLFAGKGDLKIQAQQDAMQVLADKSVEIISANDKIEIIGKKEILLTSGGAYIRIKDGKIEIHAPGTIEHKGSAFPFMGPTSLTKNFDEMPTSSLNDECFELKGEKGKPIAGVPYAIHLKGDPEKVYASGTTDDKGKTVRTYTVSAEELEVQWFVTAHDAKVEYAQGKEPPAEAELEQTASTSPLPPTAAGSARHPDLEAIANDPTVAAEMDRAWNQSNPNGPGVDKKEHGFWILEDQNTGEYAVQNFPTNTATRDSVQPGPVPNIPDKDVVGFYHTHPNTAAEGYVSGASPADSNFSQGTGVSGMIRSHDGMYYFDQ